MRRYRLPITTWISVYALRQAGWRLIWTPTVELYHSESSSVGRHDAPERMSEFNAAVALMRTALGRRP